MRRFSIGLNLFALLLLEFTVVTVGQAAVQYSNNFDNPSSPEVSTAWPEWITWSDPSMKAANGRIEWYGSGGNNDWIRLDKEMPEEYVVEFDFFYQADINGRFSFWPFTDVADEDATNDIFARHNYFMRKNTHYFNGADTIPSEGPRDLTLPTGSKAHRLRFEVKGDHVVFLYKVKGEGGWVLIDDRDFPHVDAPKYVQLGYNHDGGTAGVQWIDNLVISYQEQNLFSYTNNFDNPTNSDVAQAWPEWIIWTENTMLAANGRIEWYGSGGNNDWLRLDRELPENYVIEFDFFYQQDINGRFSVWPFIDVLEQDAADDIFDRHNYFVRKNTHYFNGADTIPSEGPRDMTLPTGTKAHRLRFEVTGDRVVFLYKDKGEGGWILIDDRNFPHVDPPKYFQLGYNHDGGTAGVHYIDNLEIRGLAANRAEVSRDIMADNFVSSTAVPISLQITATGTIPALSITEDFPDGWSVSDVSNGGVISDGRIIWDLQNITQSMALTYTVTPPRLVRSRIADFSGNVGSGDEEERIAGDTAISIDLPYIYREAIDYDFSGSPENGKKYPTGQELGERYAQDKDGLPSGDAYARPGQDVPAIDTVFSFDPAADFYQGNPAGTRADSYAFTDYRDQGEVGLEHGASDTNASLGGLDPGDWFRYTFDFGTEDRVIIVRFSVNTWGQGDAEVDVYLDNKFKGSILSPNTPANEFNFFSVGPFAVSKGEHSIVLALPGPNAPTDIGRLEVVSVSGIGQVARTTTPDGFFQPGTPFNVTLNTRALYGNYKSVIEENLPQGMTVSAISDGGQVVGDKIIWDLPPTTTNKSVSYTVNPTSGQRFILFSGYADIGLPIAEPILGDNSVTNQVWLFGETVGTPKTDSFDGTALKAPWTVEYGSDPALQTDYQEGVDISVSDGSINFNVEPFGDVAKFDEWANGRRAPMIVRTDVPTGDFRVELDYNIADLFNWSTYQTGLFVAFNDGADTNITRDEYLFGFYEDEIRVELTNVGALGILNYNTITDELVWLDEVIAGNISAKIAVTRRGNELVFSAQLPNGTWQLVGSPVLETRQPTRIGLFTKVWGDNFVNVKHNNFTLSDLNAFTAVTDWALY